MTISHLLKKKNDIIILSTNIVLLHVFFLNSESQLKTKLLEDL